MKKFVIILLVLLSLTGCSDYKGDVVTKHADKVVEMFQNKETFVIYAGMGDCTSCKEYSDIVHEVTKNYDITFYYVSMDDSEEKEYRDMLSYDYFIRLVWMPTTYIVVDGKTVDLKENTIQYDELVDWLESYGFINK